MATRTINTDIKLSGEKEFNDQMKSVNSNLKALRAEMRAVSTSFDDNASATDKLRFKQDVLTQQIDQQKEKVRALAEMYESCKTKLGETAAKTDDYKTEMLNAQTALNKMEAAQRDLNKALNAAKAEEAARAIDKVEDSAEEAAPPVDKLADKLRNLVGATNDVVGAAPRAASRILDLAKNSETFQKAAGITTTAAKGTAYALAGLGLAGGGASVAITALGVIGFKTLAQFAIEAANSGNPAFASLAENLGELEEASNSVKAALGGVLLPALEKLSSRGAQMLRNFSEEIEAAGTDTKAIGGIMANFVKEAAEAIRDEAPTFIKQGGDLVTGLAEGIVENSDEVSAAIGETLESLADFLDDNAELIGEAAATLVSNLGTMIATNAPQLFTAGLSMIENLIAGIDGGDLGAKAADLVILLLTSLIDLAPDLFDAGVEFSAEVVKGILNADWNQIGADIINAIWEGMKSIWDTVVDWFNEKVSSLHGTAYIDVYTRQYGASVDETGTAFPHATGLDYVPYDEYPASLHRGEMVVPARLADQLRGAGIGRNTQNIGGGSSSQNVQVTNNVKVSFVGSLAQLARVLQPYIKVEEDRRGPKLIK